MPTYQTEGIVIGRTNFGEADRIVRLFTPDRGKISVVARGVRKVKSRSGGHLEPLGRVSLMLATGRNLDVVTSAQSSWYPHQLADAYERLSLAFMAAGMIDRLVEEHHAQIEVYELLGEMLTALNDGAGGPVIELWYKLRLLDLLGYRPELEGCIACGSAKPDARYWFSAARGGILDDGCRDAAARPIDTSAIKYWRLLSSHPLAIASQVSHAVAIATTTLPLADDFYHYHLGRSFSADAIGATR